MVAVRVGQLDVIKGDVRVVDMSGMLSSSYPHAVFYNSYGTTLANAFPRFTASHFHPASKLVDIQWSYL